MSSTFIIGRLVLILKITWLVGKSIPTDLLVIIINVELSLQRQNMSKESLRRRCKNDLFYLAKTVLGFDFLIKRFHKPICDFIQDMSIHRKLVRMPRGFL